MKYCSLGTFSAVLPNLLKRTGCAAARDDDGRRIFPEKPVRPSCPVTSGEQELLDGLKEHHGSLIDLVSKLVKIESVNPGLGDFSGREEIFKFSQEYLSSRGIETFLFPTHGENGTLYTLTAVLEGREPGNTLLFCGHLDTVAYTDQVWDSTAPPLGAVIRDGKLYGRGSMDMKGGNAVMMEVMVRLAEMGAPFSGTLMLLLTPDEETGGAYGAARAVEQYPRLLDAGMTLIAEPTQYAPFQSPLVIIGEKGPFWTRMTFQGKGGHGSSSNAAGSAVNRAVRFVKGLDAMTYPRGTRVSGLKLLRSLLRRFTLRDVIGMARQSDASMSLLTKSSVRCTGFSAGGQSINTVPDSAQITADFRMIPGITPDEMISVLKRHAKSLGLSLAEAGDNHDDADIIMEVLLALEGSRESFVSEEAKLLERTFEAVYKTAVVPSLSPGFTDAGHLRAAGLKQVFVVGPEGSRTHDPDEFVVIDSLYRLQELFFLTALRYLGYTG